MPRSSFGGVGGTVGVVGASHVVTGARTFNGTTDYGTAGTTIDLRVNTSKTMAGWVKFTTVPTAGRIMGNWRDDGPSRHWMIAVSDSKWQGAYVSGSANYRVVGAATGPTAGVWYHVALVVSTSATRLYVDGVEVASEVAGNAANTLTLAPFMLGCGGQVGDIEAPSNVVLADVALWTVAMSVTTIKTLADKFARPNHLPSGLVAFWRLDGTGTTETSEIGAYAMTMAAGVGSTAGPFTNTAPSFGSLYSFESRNLKVKGISVAPSVAMGASWSNMFGPMFDFEGHTRPQIDIAVSHGANLIHVKSQHKAVVLDGSITQAAYEANWAVFLDYCEENAIMVMPALTQIHNTDLLANSAAICAHVASLAAQWDSYGCVIGMDLSNELIYNSPTDYNTWAADLYTAVRPVTTKPLTISHWVTGSTNWVAPMNAFYSYVDYYDFHPYYNMVTDPAVAHLSNVRTNQFYRPYFIGEIGQRMTEGNAAISSRYNAIAAIAAEPDCLGAIQFCLRDYDNDAGAGRWGMYDADGVVGPRNPPLDEFTAWPSTWT